MNIRTANTRARRGTPIAWVLRGRMKKLVKRARKQAAITAGAIQWD